MSGPQAGGLYYAGVPQPPPSFLRFYGSLVHRLPSIFWTSAGIAGRVGFLFSLAVALVAFANQPLGQFVNAVWQGFTPWWGFAVLGLLIVYGLMRANYQSFAAVYERASRAEEREVDANQAKPRLQFTYDSREPYQHDWRATGARYLRVGLKKTGVVNANSVEARLNRIYPAEPDVVGDLPANLALRNDESAWRFDLRGTEERYLDLARREGGSGEWVLTTASRKFHLSRGDWSYCYVELAAHADNADEVKTWMNITVDEDGELAAVQLDQCPSVFTT